MELDDEDRRLVCIYLKKDLERLLRLVSNDSS